MSEPTVGTTGMTLDDIERRSSRWRDGGSLHHPAMDDFIITALCAELRTARGEIAGWKASAENGRGDLEAWHGAAKLADVPQWDGGKYSDPAEWGKRVFQRIDELMARVADLELTILRECQDQVEYEAQIIKALGVDPATDTYGGEFSIANLVGMVCDRIADLERRLAQHHAIRHGTVPKPITDAKRAMLAGYDGDPCPKCGLFYRVSSGRVWACDRCNERGELVEIPDGVP